MVKVREPRPAAVVSDDEAAAKAEKFGDAATPKKPRAKPFKSITIPFNTEADYQRLLDAADKADRRPTDFLKRAIKRAVDEQLGPDFQD